LARASRTSRERARSPVMDVIAVKDCTASVREEITHDEFLSGLKSGKAVETKSRGYETA
jgi:hypothetical protein